MIVAEESERATADSGLLTACSGTFLSAFRRVLTDLGGNVDGTAPGPSLLTCKHLKLEASSAVATYSSPSFRDTNSAVSSGPVNLHPCCLLESGLDSFSGCHLLL